MVLLERLGVARGLQEFVAAVDHAGIGQRLGDLFQAPAGQDPELNFIAGRRVLQHGEDLGHRHVGCQLILTCLQLVADLLLARHQLEQQRLPDQILGAQLRRDVAGPHPGLDNKGDHCIVFGIRRAGDLATNQLAGAADHDTADYYQVHECAEHSIQHLPPFTIARIIHRAPDDHQS